MDSTGSCVFSVITLSGKKVLFGKFKSSVRVLFYFFLCLLFVDCTAVSLLLHPIFPYNTKKKVNICFFIIILSFLHKTCLF